MRELSDLISLSAQVHDGVDGPAVADREAAALWLASAPRSPPGPTAAHERAKARLRAETPTAPAELWAARERRGRRGRASRVRLERLPTQ